MTSLQIVAHSGCICLLQSLQVVYNKELIARRGAMRLLPFDRRGAFTHFPPDEDRRTVREICTYITNNRGIT
jgi:hypothetical protein